MNANDLLVVPIVKSQANSSHGVLSQSGSLLGPIAMIGFIYPDNSPSDDNVSPSGNDASPLLTDQVKVALFANSTACNCMFTTVPSM